MFLPPKWVLEDALWAHYMGNHDKALYLMKKIIRHTVKETPNG